MNRISVETIQKLDQALELLTQQYQKDQDEDNDAEDMFNFPISDEMGIIALETNLIENQTSVKKLVSNIIHTVPSQSSWTIFLLPTEMVLKTEN